jgi:uncharacterized protein YbaP (TraB family)
MLRFALLVVLASLVSSHLCAQKNSRPNYKLLWRISGNGLNKPSYLFGTMHAQDKRAFNLNDSVIAKVLECEAFAMEVHPDSVNRFMASIILNQDRQNFESQMTPNEFVHYDSLMKKKTGLSLKKFKTTREATYFLQQRGMKKDKNTFLDAWLYNIAREKGKLMTGLESIAVQAKLYDDAREVSDFKKFLESDSDYGQSIDNLFDLYYEGNVEAIYKYSKSNTPEDQFKSIIIERNMNMTDNIVREIHQRSVFMAIGAAHLGGEPGVVNLLKQKGYSVTPVNAPFSGTASKYKSTGTTEKWFSFSSDEGGYAIEMPQAPVPFEKAGVPVTFQTYVDIGTLTVYMAAHIPMGAVLEKENVSKTLDGMVARMSASQKITNVKKIIIDGKEGRELDAFAEGHLFKVRLTIGQSIAYMLMVGATKETANSPDAKRFLSSFKTIKPSNPGTEQLTSKEGAFSVSVPAKMAKKVSVQADPSSGEPVTMNLFVGTDHNTGTTYIVRYNDFPAGYVSLDDSTYIHGTVQALNENLRGADLSIKKMDYNGYPSIHYTFNVVEHSMAVEGIATLRGERFYLLMLTSTKDEKAKQSGNDFIESFKFLPVESPALKDISFPEGFALKVPVTFESDSSITYSDDMDTYSFVDRFSGMMFLITVEPFSKFDQSENADTFFHSVKNNYVTQAGALKDSTIIDQLTREYTFQSQKNSATTRIRSVIAGTSFIALWAYMPRNEEHLTLPDQVFSSFKVTPTSRWSLFDDKSELILKGISSSDTTERKEAKAALSTHAFKVSHLPKIYQAFNNDYGDDGTWHSTKASLLNILGEVYDDRTQSAIKQIYPTLPDTTTLRDRALGILTSFKTSESVKSVVDMIATDNSGHSFHSYMVLNSLEDSLSLFNDVVIDLLNTLPKFEQKTGLYQLVKSALDSGTFSGERRSEVIRRMTEIALKTADTREAANADEPGRLVYEKYTLVDILSSVPFTPEVQSIATKFAAEDDDDTKFLAAQLLLKNGVAVPQRDLELLASTQATRLLLYEELRKYNKLQLMDKKFTTYRMLAESEMLEYLNAEDEYPDNIKFLKEKSVVVDGQKMKVLVFTYGYNDMNEKYTAVAGPYDIKAKEFKRGDLTAALYEEYKSDKELYDKLSAHLAESGVKLVD